MPELPEVETIRRQLQSEIVGEILVEIEVRDEMVFLAKKMRMENRKVVKIGRQGKYMFWYFDDGSGLQVHLKMTGRYVLADDWYETAPHTRVVYTLQSGRKLYYWDTRRFGYIKLVENIAETEEKVKKMLGPDPWKMDEKYLLSKAKNVKRTIKDMILDQKIVAGVGNIYANDALFLAGIDPRRSASSLLKEEAKEIVVAIRQVIERGLLVGGASDNTYRDLYGGKGGYQNEFLVYGKTKGVCVNCGEKLLYTKIGGRGTWICENCQK